MLYASPLTVKWVKDFQGRILNPLRLKFLVFEGESPEYRLIPDIDSLHPLADVRRYIRLGRIPTLG